MLIQWYPGHMAKARRQLTESLKLIDVVVEIVDARAPRATRNPDFDDLFKEKKRVVLLNKSDLASPALTKAWITEYKKNGIESIEFVATNSAKKKAALELMENAAKEKVEKSLAKGVKRDRPRHDSGHTQRGQIHLHKPHRRNQQGAGGG